VARETLHDLAGQLSALLSDMDAAIRARLQELARYETRRRLETTEQNKGLRAVVVSALRWFTNSAELRPTFRRARSPHEKSRRHRRSSL